MKADIWNGKLVIPPIKSSIFLDIETDVYTEKIWMIGCRLGNDYKFFTANNWEEESKILDDLANYLDLHPGLPLIIYSRTNFDFRYLWNAAKRLQKTNLMRSLTYRSWIDLATLLGRVYKPRIRSIALKNLGMYLSYDFSHEGMDGFEVSVRYSRDVRKNKSVSPEFKKIAEEYNKDDLDIMVFILMKFKDKIYEEPRLVFKEGTVSLLSKIRTQLHDYNRGEKRMRISVANQDIHEYQYSFQKYGIPLPRVETGNNKSRLVWTSKLGLERFDSLFQDLNID